MLTGAADGLEPAPPLGALLPPPDGLEPPPPPALSRCWALAESTNERLNKPLKATVNKYLCDLFMIIIVSIRYWYAGL
jgi:hypothetical protein